MVILDGKKVAAGIHTDMHTTINHLQGRPPCLAVILVGNHPSSHIYVKKKTKTCAEIGIRSIKKELKDDISQKDLFDEIDQLNERPDVDGILVQLPLPHQIHPSAICSRIDPHKDVDGFHPINMGKLLIGESDGFIPCTPLGIKLLLEYYEIDIRGKHAVIVGRSNIVGKPMAALLMQRGKVGNATVTLAHRYTKHLADICRLADLLIVAVGQPQFITEHMVKEGAIVIDVGINKIDNETNFSSRLVGDVDFERVQHKCSYITPVPGGIGPMTIAGLLHNTLESYCKREKIS
jgi:methylenetetrahydrofolate dehydrogenase (NADP+)/methenyltetrahydrofolate cyclohydrolase